MLVVPGQSLEQPTEYDSLSLALRSSNIGLIKGRSKMWAAANNKVAYVTSGTLQRDRLLGPFQFSL